MIDVLLAVLGTGCCLVLPSLLVALPLALAARALVQKRPAARVLVVAASTLAGAGVSAVALAAAGVAIGMSIEDESAGEALVFLVTTGLVGGGIAGSLAALVLTLVATRPSASSAPAP